MKKKSKAEIEYLKKFNKAAQQLGVKSNQPKPKTKTQTTQQKVTKAQRSGVQYDVVQKNTTNKKSYVSNVGKLLNDENLEIKTVPKEIATQVAQARADAKMTQEELAKKVSENVAYIRDLEKGEGVYKPKIVEKIEKVLNVKFERSWKK